MQKLDIHERWVCGERVSSHNEKEYQELLKYCRAKNKRLGYGDDEKNWEQEQYERERRLIKQREKMNYNKKNNNDEIMPADEDQSVATPNEKAEEVLPVDLQAKLDALQEEVRTKLALKHLHHLHLWCSQLLIAFHRGWG